MLIYRLNNVLEPVHSGFKPHRVMDSALVVLHNDLLREANRSKMSLLIPLSLSAAFDTVNHGILGRLSGLGIGSLSLA